MKRYFSVPLVTGAIFAVFSSCSKPDQVEPQEPLPSLYELEKIRYYEAVPASMDTLILKLKGGSVSNAGEGFSTQTFESSFEELTKTSLFEITNKPALPADVKLETLAVSVPERWQGNEAYAYFPEKFALHSAEQQKPYGAYRKETLSIKVPPKSAISVDRQIEAYRLTCSFTAVLVNKTTGQQFPVSGYWKGISHYNNASIKLTQRSLDAN